MRRSKIRKNNTKSHNTQETLKLWFFLILDNSQWLTILTLMATSLLLSPKTHVSLLFNLTLLLISLNCSLEIPHNILIFLKVQRLESSVLSNTQIILIMRLTFIYIMFCTCPIALISPLPVMFFLLFSFILCTWSCKHITSFFPGKLLKHEMCIYWHCYLTLTLTVIFIFNWYSNRNFKLFYIFYYSTTYYSLSWIPIKSLERKDSPISLSLYLLSRTSSKMHHVM